MLVTRKRTQTSRRLSSSVALPLFAFAYAVGGGTAARAQSGESIPLPKLQLVDQQGIEVNTARRTQSEAQISIGAAEDPTITVSGGAGGFSGTPLWGYGYQHCITTYRQCDGGQQKTYDLGGRHVFEMRPIGGSALSDGSWASTLSDGSKVINGVVYDKQGWAWHFGPSSVADMNHPEQPTSVLTSIAKPDGEVLTYNYANETGVPAVRSVTSSRSYQVQLTYQRFTASLATGMSWPAYSGATLVNRAIQYCDPVAVSCPTGGSILPSISYTPNSDGSTSLVTTGSVAATYVTESGQSAGSKYGSPTLPYYMTVVSGAGVRTTYGGNASMGFSLPSPWAISAQCNQLPYVSRVIAADNATWNYSFTVPAGPTNDQFGTQIFSDCRLGAIGTTKPDQSSISGSTDAYGTYTVTDELNRSTRYTYLQAIEPVTPYVGQNIEVTSVTSPEGNKVTFAYDDPNSGGRANVQSASRVPKPGSSEGVLTWNWSYPSSCLAATMLVCNKPDYEIDPKGNRTDYTYDLQHGGVLTKTLPADANGLRPQIRYIYQQVSASYVSAAGHMVQGTPIWRVIRTSQCRTQASCIGTADEVVTSYTYDQNLLVATVTIRSGNGTQSATMTNSYDGVGNLVATDGPLPGPGDTTRYVYDAMRRLTAVLGPDPDGTGPLPVPVTRTTYNGDGQPILVEAGHAADQSDAALAAMTVDRALATTYDIVGRKIRETVLATGATQLATQYGYDLLGRLSCTAVRMNPLSFGSLPASACSLGAQGNFGPDRIVHNVYDVAGQLLKVQKAYGVTTANFYPTTLQQDYATYEYTQNGKQKAVTDANNNRAEMTWDGFDRQLTWTLPSKTATGQVNGDDYEQYGYDPDGNRTSLRKRDGVTLIYAYDSLNRLSQKTVPASATGAPGYNVYYGYDLQGRQIYARFGSSSGPGITSTYDPFGRVSTSTTNMDGTSRTFASQYDPHGNRTVLSGDAGYLASFAFDATDRMTAYQGVFTISYDAAGRRSGIDMGPGYSTSWTSWHYDSTGRLQTQALGLSDATANQSVTFGYNPASQIITEARTNDAYAYNGAANVAWTYQVNGLNQYSAVGPNAYVYDANGNLISDGANSYTYDAENRLVSRSNGTTLSYDPNGRLWQVSGPWGLSRFVYDGDRLVQEYNASGTPTGAYVHGPGADEPLTWYSAAGRRHLHADHQGSITAIADDAGNKVSINAYDTWGVPNAANIGRFGYTGQVWLRELGMWYYKARIYSPMLGRFLQTDPIGYKDQVNLYAYVGNDPVDGTDPMGLYECGNPQACDRYEEAKKELLAVAAYLGKSRSSRDRSVGAIIRAGISDMGERGVNNGTRVDANSGTNFARWNSEAKSLEINLDRFNKSSALERTGAVGHELTHEVQYQAGLITDSTLLSVERQAYTNQAIIEHTIGRTPYWDSASGDINRSLISRQARNSCLTDVGTQDKWYLCR